jgi:curved DNA-binding protein CbpA
MVPRDDRYYRRLELRRDASHADIVSAYRRMAVGAHPDTHPEDPEAAGRFREITEAYEVLGDPVRRAGYDRQGIGTGVRHRDRTPGSGAPMAHHVAQPIVLGMARYPLSEGVWLQVGPVRTMGGGQRRPERSDQWTWDDDGSGDRVVGSWWGP